MYRNEKGISRHLDDALFLSDIVSVARAIVLCKNENLVKKVDSRDNLMSAMKEHIPGMVQEENSDCCLESDDVNWECRHEDIIISRTLGTLWSLHREEQVVVEYGS
ncbi:hypothetical protein HanXRQr2_Chr04g0164941 [Helianthus annuus]|uniref:Uncharacterized protein n=1 Tax=Helianthus annuus TaxID=4232 RepID=A0A251SWD9_HELAN|nr:hypothetical protein HanXRQr2_Chr04g0164941 [Helianthus annuus]KAJ0931201.1 hypothetical protein HanPSC8_Chr04g0158801 [Helianthus annuus]